MLSAPVRCSRNRIVMLGSTMLLIGLMAGQKSNTPAQEESLPVDDSSGRISVAYARACHRLAKAELAEAQEENRRYQNSVTSYDMQRLRAHLRSAEQNVSFAEQGADTSLSILGHIELQSQLADLELRMTEELHKQNDTLLAAARLERLRAYAEVLRLRVDLARAPDSTLRLLDHLHWETHRLSEEILLLNRRIERLEVTSRQ